MEELEYIEISAKNVDDAITEACQHFGVTSDRLDYEVVQQGSTGFLGLAVKPAIIKARVIGETRTVQGQCAGVRPGRGEPVTC